ncbi:histidine kinase [Streptomyces sp. NBC_00322]|uniref:sensor histidine kinase n=1 Tax=Streptomyces sp. NBC_00322 TaxID=2975712 RepID=UPI002E2D5D99|nr:histidine kinase [Streptomyces sp. NBC_00322]
MRRALKASARALFGTRAGLRWLHLILGGALLMPYWLVGTVIVGPVVGAKSLFSDSLALQFGAYAIALPTAAVTALFFPLTRPLAVGLAKALCGVPAERFAEGPARSRAARLRASGWFTLHAGIGALISGATLALPPFAVSLMVLPFFPALRGRLELPHYPAWQLALFPFAGVAMLIALAGCAAAAGALLARQAPVLLGPTPADRLAAAERRATELAERNRLARELHDSVGHALSAVTLQAGAARRVLDSDPGFVREALAAIEETTRRTVGELDSVLGLLRQDDDNTTQLDGPTLDTLDGLLARSGVPVSLSADGDLAAVPAPVSREAYRIVQEGLSNALRHAGASPVTLWIALRGEELEIMMENPLPDTAPVVRPGGGRGVRGIAERAALLGGRAQAGAQGAVWLLCARLPLGGDR